MPRAVDLRLVAERLIGCRKRWGSFEIGGTFGGTAPRGRALGEAAKPISYSESGADGRIRTGDPLFTKQLLCQLSYVGVRTDYMRGLLPARRVLYEVATVVCAGSRGLTVTWLTGTLSLRNVVTKVFRLGSHQVIK